jgi:hypothetical protein
LFSVDSFERQAQLSAFGEIHQQLRLNAAQSAVSHVLAWWRDRVDMRRLS